MDKKSSKISVEFWASVGGLASTPGIFDGFASIIYIRHRIPNVSMCVGILDTCSKIKFYVKTGQNRAEKNFSELWIRNPVKFQENFGHRSEGLRLPREFSTDLPALFRYGIEYGILQCALVYLTHGI